MRPLYQSHWHGIPFSSLGVTLSLNKLPDTSFYSAFYKQFHSRYSSANQLSSEWLEYKYAVGAVLKKLIPSDVSILSLGAGLALIEEDLVRSGYEMIDVHEVSSEPLKWAINNNLLNSTFVSDTLESLSRSTYDFVLLNGIDYALDNTSLAQFLSDSLSLLNDKGTLLLISVSYDPDHMPIRKRIKDYLLNIYYKLGFVPGSQLWGFIRTESELVSLASQFPGYSFTCETLSISSTWPTLLIKLQKS